MIKHLVKILLIACTILFMWQAVLNASILRDDLLRIHASIVPKTVFMDYGYKERLVDGKINICIISKQNDLYYAKDFARYVNTLYREGINGLKITISILTYSDFLGRVCKGATIFYLLPAEKELIKQATSKIGGYGLKFSYSPAYLAHGAEISLKIKYKVKPVLNLKALKENAIFLRPVLLRISEFFSAQKK